MRALLKPALTTLMLTCASAALAQASAPPPLEAYGDLPEIEDMAVSPSGKSLAMAGRVRGERKLTVFEGPKLRASTLLGESKLRSVRPATRKQMLEAAMAFVQKHNPAQ